MSGPANRGGAQIARKTAWRTPPAQRQRASFALGSLHPRSISATVLAPVALYQFTHLDQLQHEAGARAIPSLHGLAAKQTELLRRRGLLLRSLARWRQP